MARKPKNKIYFGVDQEQAVVSFLTTECPTQRNSIFNEYLYDPLTTMIDSIIRRYKLYRKDLSFEEIHCDAMSFLITKIEKFDHTKNYKAYSYLGTVCKHYLMGLILKDQKENTRYLSYEDMSSDIEERDEFSYHIDDYKIDYSNIITELKTKMVDFMATENLNENEMKLGYALLDIFNDFNLNEQIGEGNKFNKNLILLNIRELTSMNTKEIRVSLKKFKKIYGDIMKQFVD